MPEDRRKKRRVEIGALNVRELPDGRELAAIPMLFGTRLTIGPAGGDFVDDFYCYHSPRDCMAAVEDWDGEGDPPGRWHRHLKTSRRRIYDPAGNVVKEWIAP